MKFLAYFQAYTNTYAPVGSLINLYEEALKNPNVIGLVIATRPDCLTTDVINYLQKLAENHYIMVEIGIESCENTTLEMINRGHTFEDSEKAINLLYEAGIHSCAHLILGLPGEDRKTILRQAQVISRLPVENLKLHQLQIHRDTLMARQYERTPEIFNIYKTADEYIELVIDYIELLRPSIIIERFVSESPDEFLIAPNWGIKNFEFVAKVEKRLKERNTWQGKFYDKHNLHFKHN